MNYKIHLLDEVELIEKNGVTMVLFNDKSITLDPTEQMILKHCENYDLSEIVVILREFYQMDEVQAKAAIEQFIFKMNDMIVIADVVKDELGANVMLKQNPKIELIEDDDETGILRDYSKGKMVYINSAGIKTWKYLQSEHSIAEVIEYLLSLYYVDRVVLEKDINVFINSLVEKQYILLS